MLNLRSAAVTLLDYDIIRFSLVGGSGFLLNLILLFLFYKRLHMPIFLAQLLSGELALFSNFILHHRWTYRKKHVTKSLAALLWQFHVTQWVSIVGSAIIVSAFVSSLHIYYLAALIVSSILALGWNFVWTKLFIWRHEEKRNIPA